MRSCSQLSPAGTHKEPVENPEHSPPDLESQFFCESEIKLSNNHDPNLTLIFKISDHLGCIKGCLVPVKFCSRPQVEKKAPRSFLSNS